MASDSEQIMAEIRQKMLDYQKALPSHNMRMQAHLKKLKCICENPVVIAAYNEAVSHAHPYTESGDPNPWLYTTIEDFIFYFNIWFTDLSKPSGGLGFIFPFSWFYNENYSAYYFLNEFKSNALTKTYTKEMFAWVLEFIMIRGEFMDSPASVPEDIMDAWLSDPSTNIDDFIVPKCGFKSYNEFFTRELDMSKNPRPISNPDDESIVVASADTIINLVLSDLTLETNINVKGRQISVKNLLDDSKFASHFVGGTAVSCVLLPNVYHHYHAPVSGNILESKDIPGIYNGIMDGEHWFNDMSNPGQGDTDFSAFEDFHRAYYVIDTGKYGHVAIIPVGLNTISRITPSLVGKDKYYVAPGEKSVPIKKGDKLGNFAYGGSLNIVMFEKGVFPCVSLLMGCRLGQMYEKVEEEESNKVKQPDRPANVQHSGSRKRGMRGRTRPFP